MSLFALGLNHHTAPLDVRERVVFHVERLRDALGALRTDLAGEAAILSTCNRTELYLAAGRSHPARRRRRVVCALPPVRSNRARALPLHAAAGAGGAPRVPRCLGARFDGARRAADPEIGR